MKGKKSPRAPGFAFDPVAAVAHLRQADSQLAELIARQGPFDLELRPVKSIFEALLRSIIYQQLHGRAAEAIHGRVLAELRQAGPVAPATLAKVPDKRLRAAGLSAGKLRALRDLGEKSLAGVVPTLAQARQMNEAELTTRLTAVRGIGPWTVHMLMIFYLGHGNVMPTGDYAIRAAFQRLYRKRQEPTPAHILKHARRWEPYRSVASWYLWRSLDTKT
jgi:3-methyladenine DNA glycosylase/8-oxoguanine DNA glycosylase